MITSSNVNWVDPDILGKAMFRHYFEKAPCKIELSIDGLQQDAMDSEYFFRSVAGMNDAELEALQRCRGRVLDVGGGAGCHALLLQERGFEVVVVERSELSCTVMKARGVVEVLQSDIMALSGQKFDTILLLMNGFGIAGTEDGLVDLLLHLKSLLAPGGCIMGDSTDIRYFKEEQDCVDLAAGNFSEVQFEARLDNDSQRFPWIYPDETLLQVLAEEAGLRCRTLLHTDEYHFLCEMYV
jgi:SAM-dependent methyltransferase